MTALYNTRPSWLVNLHRDLDAAVAAAYGWPDRTPETSDEEILRRLLDLNLTRAFRLKDSISVATTPSFVEAVLKAEAAVGLIDLRERTDRTYAAILKGLPLADYARELEGGAG